MDPAICSAIAEKRLIEFRYEGCLRVVEPYCHGITETEDEVLRAFQIGGHRETEEDVGWKFFREDKMEDIVLLNDTFNEKYPTCDFGERMKEVHCCV